MTEKEIIANAAADIIKKARMGGQKKDDIKLDPVIVRATIKDIEMALMFNHPLLFFPLCHYIKPYGVMGKEYMVENMLLRHCVGCGDEEQCWNVGQLKDLIEIERKTLLNQDY